MFLKELILLCSETIRKQSGLAAIKTACPPPDLADKINNLFFELISYCEIHETALPLFA